MTNTMDNQAILKNLGLTDNEAKVYLANLELGQATVQELARQSGVKRTTVYTVLDDLKQQGILSQIKKGLKTFLVAEAPENLIGLAEKRLEALKESLPELKSIYNLAGPKPKVRFYEGRDGYLAVYENILREQSRELLAISSYEHFCQHVDWDYEEKWTRRRIKMGMYLRWLDFDTLLIEKRISEGKKALREIRILPPEFVFTSTMFIYNEKAVVVSGRSKEFIAVVIENSEFSQMFRQVFEMLWFGAGRAVISKK